MYVKQPKERLQPCKVCKVYQQFADTLTFDDEVLFREHLLEFHGLVA